MQNDKVEEKEQAQNTVQTGASEDPQEAASDQDVEKSLSDVAEEAGPEESQPNEEVVGQEISDTQRLTVELQEAKDKYLRLYSEFENFRRRTAKERIELIGSASKDLMEILVPVLDDFERALKSFDPETDKVAMEGTELIYNKFKKVLESKGLKKMEIKKGDAFNDDFHEAITQIPADKELAGKIVDVVENGYFLNDKVVRFAKVVTGAKS